MAGELDRGLGVVSFQDGVAISLQTLTGQAAKRGFVLDQEDSPNRAGWTLSRVKP
jgi:hypothetical protein